MFLPRSPYHKSPVVYNDGKEPEGLRVAEIPPQNVAIKLFMREINSGRRCGIEKYLQRSCYQSIFPNFTVTHVEKPPCFLRKFTPDGKHFIAFSADQMSIEVYAFKGPQSAAKLFTSEAAPVIATPASTTEDVRILKTLRRSHYLRQYVIRDGFFFRRAIQLSDQKAVLSYMPQRIRLVQTIVIPIHNSLERISSVLFFDPDFA